MRFRPQLSGVFVDGRENKLGCAYAAEAFRAWDKFKLDEGKEMYTDVFTNVVCKGLRMLEAWRQIMDKRFGSVAKNSKAMDRLCADLATLPGLRKIITNNTTGVPMHGKSESQPGIPECYYLVKELEKCAAGGLPPPQTIPDEAEAKKREEVAKRSRKEK